MSSLAELIPFQDAPPARALRKRVGEVLGSGLLVALPTETVYGVAARADDPAALERLRDLKGRDPREPLTWHVAEREAVERFEHLVPLARRLVKRYWPGPLTLVLEGVPSGLEGIALDGWTGLRLPAHRGTAGLIASFDFPVVLSSVNKRGEEPLVDAGAIVERFGAGLELVLDGGPSRLGEASGVLKLGRAHFDVLREGLSSIDELRAAAGLSIGFCCTGNTCRSPMAEGLAKKLLRERLGTTDLAAFGFRVVSMGVFAPAGAPPSAHAVEVMRDVGYDLTGHETSPAISEEIQKLDRVFCLTPSHLDALVAMVPPGRAKHVELLDPEGNAVPDPIGGTRDDYRRCMERIRACIEKRAADWA